MVCPSVDLKIVIIDQDVWLYKVVTEFQPKRKVVIPGLHALTWGGNFERVGTLRFVSAEYATLFRLKYL